MLKGLLASRALPELQVLLAQQVLKVDKDLSVQPELQVPLVRKEQQAESEHRVVKEYKEHRGRQAFKEQAQQVQQVLPVHKGHKVL